MRALSQRGFCGSLGVKPRRKFTKQPKLGVLVPYFIMHAVQVRAVLCQFVSPPEDKEESV